MNEQQTESVLKTNEAIQADFFIPDAPIDDGKAALNALKEKMRKEMEKEEWERKFGKKVAPVQNDIPVIKTEELSDIEEYKLCPRCEVAGHHLADCGNVDCK